MIRVAVVQSEPRYLSRCWGMTSPSLAGSVWYASILGSTFSVVRMARPWVRAVMLQEGCITVFHPGSTCSRCCFTSTFLNTRSFGQMVGTKVWRF